MCCLIPAAAADARAGVAAAPQLDFSCSCCQTSQTALLLQVRNEGRYGVAEYEQYIRELKGTYPSIYVSAGVRCSCSCAHTHLQRCATRAAASNRGSPLCTQVKPTSFGYVDDTSLFVAFEGRATEHTPVFKARARLLLAVPGCCTAIAAAAAAGARRPTLQMHSCVRSSAGRGPVLLQRGRHQDHCGGGCARGSGEGPCPGGGIVSRTHLHTCAHPSCSLFSPPTPQTCTLKQSTAATGWARRGTTTASGRRRRRGTPRPAERARVIGSLF